MAAIDPPYRTDPFQNIVNVQWRPKFRFGHSFGMAVASAGDGSTPEWVYAGEGPPTDLYLVDNVGGPDFINEVADPVLHGTMTGFPPPQYPNSDPAAALHFGATEYSDTVPGVATLNSSSYILSSMLYRSDPAPPYNYWGPSISMVSFDFSNLRFTVSGWSQDPGIIKVGDVLIPYRAWGLVPPWYPWWTSCGFLMELRKEKTTA